MASNQRKPSRKRRKRERREAQRRHLGIEQLRARREPLSGTGRRAAWRANMECDDG